MTRIFGILNITPDSFSDGGKFFDPEKALTQAQKLFDQGADFVDVGGESTRPGASVVEPDEEWGRISKVIEALVKKYPGKISLDTRHHHTAEKFLSYGGSILNDVSGFQDPHMIEVAASHDLVCIINHFPGKDTTEVHQQKIDSLQQVRDDLLNRKEKLVAAGISSEKIILDPGIGFGKTMYLNWKLLKFAELVPDEKVMIGHSRKRFLGPDRFERESNIYAAEKAIETGAAYLRVHDPGHYVQLKNLGTKEQNS